MMGAALPCPCRGRSSFAGPHSTDGESLCPKAVKEKQEIRREIQQDWKHIVAMAVLAPLAFILVLMALKTTPVSYVAPARELNIVFGVFFGTNLLKEADAKKKNYRCNHYADWHIPISDWINRGIGEHAHMFHAYKKDYVNPDSGFSRYYGSNGNPHFISKLRVVDK